jgi:8-oxo-dGTP pyrophosphatase MutT (NUDIX family)
MGQYPMKMSSEHIIKVTSQSKPTCGAIIFNKKNEVLVVKSIGKYGFPKGGKNEEESSEDCAAREVKEEVGLFIHSLIRSEDRVEFMGPGEALITYYIVRRFNGSEELKIDRN